MNPRRLVLPQRSPLNSLNNKPLCHNQQLLAPPYLLADP